MLEIKELTKSFGAFKALDGLNMTVPQGAVYGLVGPNGAGKSTAIRHVTGVYPPESGSVTLGGSPIFENAAVKSRIASVTDDLFFFSGATVEDMRKFYSGIYPAFDDALFRRMGQAFDLPAKTPVRPVLLGVSIHSILFPRHFHASFPQSTKPNSFRGQTRKKILPTICSCATHPTEVLRESTEVSRWSPMTNTRPSGT